MMFEVNSTDIAYNVQLINAFNRSNNITLKDFVEAKVALVEIRQVIEQLQKVHIRLCQYDLGMLQKELGELCEEVLSMKKEK